MAVILVTWLIAGVLDAGAALGFFLARGNRKPGMLFRYIASAVFGPKAFEGGHRMVVLGLCFHFCVALCWVGLYFAVWPWVATWDMGLLLDAVIYGVIVWCGMNLVVVPLSRAVPRPLTLAFVSVNILILIATIGLPCAYAARHFGSGGGSDLRIAGRREERAGDAGDQPGIRIFVHAFEPLPVRIAPEGFPAGVVVFHVIEA
jgi:hypothetical protein